MGNSSREQRMTNREFWLQLFQNNDIALISAITLCQRFAPGGDIKEGQKEYIAEKKKWLDEDAPPDAEEILKQKT